MTVQKWICVGFYTSSTNHKITSVHTTICQFHIDRPSSWNNHYISDRSLLAFGQCSKNFFIKYCRKGQYTCNRLFSPFATTITIIKVFQANETFENIVGKGKKNAGCLHFHFSPQCLWSFSGQLISGILRGSVIKCLTNNPVVLGSSRIRSPGFFVRVSLG